LEIQTLYLYVEGLNDFKKVEELGGLFSDLYYKLAIGYYISNNTDKAESYLNKQIGLEEVENIYQLQASIYLDQNKPELAKISLEKQMSLDPNADAYASWALYYVHIYDLESAKKAIEKSKEIDVNNNNLYIEGVLFLLLEQYEDALRLLKQCDGRRIDVKVGLLIANIHLQNRNEIDRLRSELHGKLENKRKHYAIGEAFSKVNNFQLAHEYFQNAINLGMEEARVYCNLAVTIGHLDVDNSSCQEITKT